MAGGLGPAWTPQETFVSIDLETTGTDPERDQIIELGAVRFVRGCPGEVFSRLVRPGTDVPAHILRITGISETELASSPPAGEVIGEYLAFLGACTLVGHNLPFDVEFLRRAAAAAGLDFRTGTLLDTLSLSRALLPFETSHALEALGEALGLESTGTRHRACADAETAGRLLALIWERAVARDPATLRVASAWLEPAREQLPGVWDLFEAARRSVAGTGAEDGRPHERGDRRPAGEASRRHAARTGAPEPVSGGNGRRPVARGEVEPLVEGAFSAGGLLAAVVPGFEVRPEQAEMTAAVLQRLNSGGVLAVEAGTGVGKSLAYLLPAIAVAERTGERVVVSTHTVTLQDQLAENDLPLVAGALGRAVNCTVLKGRTNYLCLRKWEEFLSGALVADETERLFGLRALMWLEETTTGDSAELNLGGPEQDCWELVGADESCWGTYCPRARACYVNQARERAERADVVVVNHSLICVDLAAENRVLPPYQHLIIDEAHHFEGVATEHLGLAADRGHLSGLLGGLASGRRRERRRSPARRSAVARMMEQAPTETVETLSQNAAQALSAVDRLYGLVSPAVADPADNDGASSGGPAELRYGREMAGLPEGSLSAALEASADIGAAARHGARLADSLPAGNPGGIELGRIAHAAAVASAAVGQLARADRPDWVYWAERDAAGARLRGVPIDVGEELGARLWPNLRSVTMVSATLAVSGSFEHFLGRLGLALADRPAAATKLLLSPFDFRRQVLLCLPNDLPLPEGGSQDRRYAAAVADFLGGLLPATGGRALVLFTSHRLLRQVHALTADELAGRGLRVYGQGIDGGRSRLLRAMRSEERVVVYGTATFWEGVDVRGPQLSCLVITRLPFPRPDEPLVAARHERLAGRGEDPFAGYSLPQAVLRFKQGFGRLIRSATDRGVVVVLDGRLLRRRYGRVFARSLPEPSYCAGPSEQVLARVRDFLAEGAHSEEGGAGRRPGFSWRT